MKKNGFLVLPHQLFRLCDEFKESSHILVVEHAYYFSRLSFHKQKLMLHRASMKAFFDEITAEGAAGDYFDHTDTSSLLVWCKKHAISSLTLYDPIDKDLTSELISTTTKANITLTILESPGFFLETKEIVELFPQTKGQYSMAHFYIQMRKKLSILLTPTGKPLGGKWSFDAENRLPLKSTLQIPAVPHPNKNRYVSDAREYVRTHFDHHPGSDETFVYPITRKGAEAFLRTFLKKKLNNFGPYQDAISSEHPFLFHSLLSSVLNIGLITPHDIIKQALLHAETTEVALSSLEGFIRQVIGWREFVRATYIQLPDEQWKRNIFNHKRKLPRSFWNGTTNIDPIDTVITKALTYAYAHHIERLMIVGNFMLLTETDPEDVYRWFMEFFIDSYDWVMVPNVYGMSQYADGGTITTKPYCSGSAYILRMSNFKKGPWCTIWDALYWNFINKNRATFKENHRMSMIVTMLSRMNPKKLSVHLKDSHHYLENLLA